MHTMHDRVTNIAHVVRGRDAAQMQTHLHSGRQALYNDIQREFQYQTSHDEYSNKSLLVDVCMLLIN